MIWLQAQIYHSAWEALDALQMPKDVMEKLQVLECSHLKTSTTLLDPSQSGWKHAELPWFWYLDVANNSLSSNHMKECKPSSSLQ
jgi:predicted  nucleic acid-binding Zn ribbon protein